MSLNKIVVFDLDNTITKKDTYLAFLIFCLKQNPLRLFRCYFLPFAVLIFKLKLKDNSWLKKTFLGAIIGGTQRDDVNSLVDDFLSDIKDQYYSQALGQIQYHKEQSDYLVLASASYDFYVEKIGKELGFDQIICTKSVWSNGRLIGDIDGENCYGPNKLAQIKKELSNILDNYKTVAYSDHHSDKYLLEWADLGIAVNPTDKLRVIAEQTGFEIRNW